ncbi:histone-lysine N-methyltransferase PRDM9-like [Haliotis cracherodii]|uniref:histone-lysine N-methyltransferase PRDM9-like n=1 Tax=Haliotis cracherodii TaxID=6455 RepID=UPI0039EC36A0
MRPIREELEAIFLQTSTKITDIFILQMILDPNLSHSLLFNLILQILPALSREGERPIDYKAIMKKKVCDEIEQFFTKAELTTMSNYEKLRLRNMRKNYEMMAELGLPVIKPEFMRGPKGKKRVKKVVEESDSDEEWIPASQRKSSRTVKPVATFRYPIKEEQKKRKVKQVKKEPSVKRTAKPTATETVSCPYPLRQRPDTNYMMMEGPDDDHFLYCEECNKEYEGDCPVHGPLLVITDTQVSSPSKKGERAEKTLPPGLEIRSSSIPNAGLGVFAIADFPTRTRFGPYEGDNIKDADVAHNSGYCWQVCVDGRGSHFVDAANVETANWMRFVNCARTEDEQNVTAYQFEGNIYYRSYKPILPGDELLVWYGQDYARDLGIRREVKVHHSKIPDIYPCDSCYLSFHSVGYLWKHMKNKHEGRVTDQICAMAKLYGYSVRDFTFKLGSGFIFVPHSAMGEQNLKNRQECVKLEPTVDSKILQNDCYNTEVRRKHFRSAQVISCHKCGRAFSHSVTLERHKCVIRERPFKCSVCGKGFTRADNLQQHMRCHTGEKPFKCSECGKGFTLAGNLQQHMRCHTGEKPFKCSECGKGFTVACNLQQHMRCHTGEKPFKCSECGKGFTQAGDLQRHMRCHTGEKPFKCSECGKGFTQAGDLQQHMRCHTGEKPFKCSECGKGFTVAHHLQGHMRCHTGEKPFKCSECGKGFTRGESLKNHMQCHS